MKTRKISFVTLRNKLKMPKIIQKISLKDCLRYGDEAKSYYSLYGDLYFEVPHYVKSYIIKKDKIEVVYASGSSMGIWKLN